MIFFIGGSSPSSKPEFNTGEQFEPVYVYKMLAIIQSSLSVKVSFFPPETQWYLLIILIFCFLSYGPIKVRGQQNWIRNVLMEVSKGGWDLIGQDTPCHLSNFQLSKVLLAVKSCLLHIKG